MTSSFTIDAGSGTTALDKRTLTITGNFVAGRFYRVIPVRQSEGTGNWLACDVTGSPDVVYVTPHDYPQCEENYWFHTETYDVNLNGSVESTDVVAWMAEPQDYNADNTHDSQDLAILIDAISNP
ncbi:MAG: hypothetical protein D6692_08025 [Planctomycetota bacterium]|nr:MAG: hypothetical protein D6692_08025 [Planctomycetota bacterium]